MHLYNEIVVLTFHKFLPRNYFYFWQQLVDLWQSYKYQICNTYLFIVYLGFYVAFNTVQVVSRWVVGRAEETSTYSFSGFCTVNCQPTASNYQLSHLRPCQESNPGLRGGMQECYHSTTVGPAILTHIVFPCYVPQYSITLCKFHFSVFVVWKL